MLYANYNLKDIVNREITLLFCVCSTQFTSMWQTLKNPEENHSEYNEQFFTGAVVPSIFTNLQSSPGEKDWEKVGVNVLY